MSNQVWVIRRPDADVGWDEAYGFVVIAGSAREARKIVADTGSHQNGHGSEGDEPWKHTGPGGSTAHMIAPYTEENAGIVMRDFRAG